MKKSRLISTRLEEEDAKILDEIAREENIDKATLIRKWILLKITGHKLEKAAEGYQKGLISIEEGAKMANTTLWKFRVHSRKKHMAPNPNQRRIRKRTKRNKKATKSNITNQYKPGTFAILPTIQCHKAGEIVTIYANFSQPLFAGSPCFQTWEEGNPP